MRISSTSKKINIILLALIAVLCVALIIVCAVYSGQVSSLKEDVAKIEKTTSDYSTQLDNLTNEVDSLKSEKDALSAKLNAKTTIDNVVVKLKDATTLDEISNDSNLTMGLTYRISFDFDVKNDTDLDRVSKIEIVTSGLSIRESDEVNFENIEYDDFSYDSSSQKITGILKYVAESNKSETEHISFDFFTTLSGPLNIIINVDGVKNFEYNKTIVML